MRILVAGGAGFIGSHLCAALLQQEHSVLCLDNLSTGRAHNLASCRHAPAFSFQKADITTLDPASITEPIDAIFHLASPASPRAYLSDPFATIRANTEGAFRLLELARRHHARFLFTSTSEVYGDPYEHPQRETYTGNVTTLGPRACYDESKRLGETITMEYLRQYQIDARIVRLFNVYGPHMQANDGRMVPTFIRQALAGEHLTIHGTGEQTRSLCYVSDCIKGLIYAMFAPETTGEVINLGNPIEQSVMTWAEMIIRLAKSPSATWRGLARPTDDPERRRPDITKAHRLLAWEPKVTPETGLLETIAWYRRARPRLMKQSESTYAANL